MQHTTLEKRFPDFNQKDDDDEHHSVCDDNDHLSDPMIMLCT